MYHIEEGLEGYENKVDSIGYFHVKVLSNRLDSESYLNFRCQYQSLQYLQVVFFIFVIKHQCF